MPKPFPYPFHVGIDICHWPRIRAAILKYHGDENRLHSWCNKFLTHSEISGFNRYLEAWRADASEAHLTRLALWTAGRWAAKEAAIKAHPGHKLEMKQVQIKSDISPNALHTPFAIINPPPRYVLMDEAVATKRGVNLKLRGASQEDRLYFRAHCDQVGLSRESLERFTLYRRSAPMSDMDQQVARISISHDGDFATAVCMAVDVTFPSLPQYTIDSGRGPPIHVPLKADHHGSYHLDLGARSPSQEFNGEAQRIDDGKKFNDRAPSELGEIGDKVRLVAQRSSWKSKPLDGSRIKDERREGRGMFEEDGGDVGEVREEVDEEASDPLDKLIADELESFDSYLERKGGREDEPGEAEGEAEGGLDVNAEVESRPVPYESAEQADLEQRATDRSEEAEEGAKRGMDDDVEAAPRTEKKDGAGPVELFDEDAKPSNPTEKPNEGPPTTPKRGRGRPRKASTEKAVSKGKGGEEAPSREQQ